MNFLILNGSPKGKDSVTLQTCLYLEKLYPAHRFAVLHAGVGAQDAIELPVRALMEEIAVVIRKARHL